MHDKFESPLNGHGTVSALWLGISPSTRNTLASVCFNVLVCAGFGTTAAAQLTTGTIRGTINDTTDAVIPSVQITVINTSTGLARSVLTIANGTYTVTHLNPGTYSVSAEKQGFSKKIVTGIVVQVAQTAIANVILEVGAAFGSLEVVGSVPLLQSSGTEVGQVIERRLVADLPLDGRQVLQLADLAATVVEAPGGSPASQIAGTQGPQLAINGNRQDANNYTIDGTTALDFFYNTLSVSPSIDAIQEFKVQSALSSLEWGAQGGGYVNVITKSGTNNFHGTAYEFLRNDKLDAHNVFDNGSLPVPPYKQNQFGGTFAGPIVKDRTFFFAGYEGNRKQQSITGLFSVPTLQMRQGNFSAYANNPTLFALLPKNPTTGLPYANNTLPSTSIDPAAAKLMALIPPPTNTSPNNVSGNLLGQAALAANSDQFSIRIDHRLGSSDTVSGRFLFLRENDVQPFLSAAFEAAGQNLPGFGDFVTNNARNLGVTYNKILSPTTVLQLRFGYGRTTGGQLPQSAGTDWGKLAGIQGLTTDPKSFAAPSITIGGFNPFGTSGALASGRIDNIFEGSADLSKVIGNHILKLGGSLSRLYLDPTSIYGMGTFSFNGFLTGNPFADFLLGVPFTADNTYGNLAIFHFRALQYASYVGDTWRARPNFTLDYGIRYDYRSPWTEVNGRLATLNLNPVEMVLPGSTGNLQGQAFFDPSVEAELAENLPIVGNRNAGYPPTLINANHKDFGPRLGFSWTPSSSRDTVLRGGYGIFYSMRPGWLTYVNVLLSPPMSLIKLTLNFVPGTKLPLESVLARANQDISFILPTFKNEPDPYVQNWDLAAQHSFGENTLFELRYNGSKGTKLYTGDFFNMPTVLGNPASSPFPFFAPGSAFVYSGASSIYHALILRAEKRYSHGVIISGSWTWSRSIDDDSLLASTETTNLDQSPCKKCERGPSDFNITHRVVGDFVYELPFGQGRPYVHPSGSFRSKLVGGWQLSGIFAAQTGLPFTVNEVVNQCGTGVNNCRPDVVGPANGNLPSGQRNVFRWFDTSAFRVQPLNTYGDAGRNTLVGPGLASVDLSLAKVTQFMKGQTIRFQADFFNALNKPNFDTPQRLIDAPGFGQIFSAKTPRVAQISLRYLF